MLVLARRKGEEVLIGDGVRIVVISVKGSLVRLGFDVPREVPIRRGEICFDASCQAPVTFDGEWTTDDSSSAAIASE